MIELSIIIPGKNEEFMGKTVEDALAHTSECTEIIAILDGFLPKPPIKSDPRLTVIYNPEAVGQRAAANQAAKIAKGKYLMKVDAHVAFDEGIDRKMLDAFKEVGDNVTMIPQMKNLHIFDWVCPNGHRRYQSPSGPCKDCGLPTKKDIVWIVKHNPTSITYRFDKNLHFQYWKDLSKRQTGDIVETMSIQGSCFMCTKEKWFELEICGEDFNSWGQQGVEVACKTWLSGGRVLVNKRTWYCHMFRTQGGDFGFPYHNPESKIQFNRELSKKLFQQNTWPKAIHSFQWLIDKFSPIPDWDTISKGIIYYTDNELDMKIAQPVRDKIVKIAKDKNMKITTSALHKRLDFGDKNVVLPSLKRSFYAMFKQVIACLENSSDDIVFFCEADVLYDPSHFDFTPEKKDTFYYNRNVWMLRNTDGHALHYEVDQLSGLCVYRETALKHFKERFEMVEKAFREMNDTDFGRFIRNMGFEPFTHHRVSYPTTFKADHWMSKSPNVDIKHGHNATGQRWNKDQYRNQQLLINWTESEDWNIPGWNKEELQKLQD